MLTAQIKVVTLANDKPMSLATYRQIPERHVIAADGSLAGTPWGRVNQHDKGCRGEHLHVLWQAADGELFRALVREPGAAFFSGETVDAFAESLVAHGLAPRRGELRGYVSSWRIEYGVAFFTVDSVSFRSSLSRAAMDAETGRPVDGQWRARWTQAPMDEVAAALPSMAYLDRWVELSRLPQLFIATR